MERAGRVQIGLTVGIVLLLAGCGGNAGKNVAAEAPPPAQVEREGDVNLVQVDHPEQFPLVAATEYKSPSRLVATGVVSPDVSRTVPVISIAAGRVVEIRARLGDTVKKGQVLLRVQSADIASQRTRTTARRSPTNCLQTSSSIARKAFTIMARFR